MAFWSAMGVLLALVFISDGLRLRRRMGHIPVLTPSPEATDGWRLWVAPGCAVPAGTHSAAVALARARGWMVVDLVPSRWASLRCIIFAQGVDPEKVATAPLAPGWSAGQALLVSEAVLDRARLTERAAPQDAAEFVALARVLKCFAAREFGYAVAPGLVAADVSAAARFGVYREAFLSFAPAVLAIQAALYGLAAASAVWGGPWGWAAIVGLHVQAAVALVGGPVWCPDVWLQLMFGWPWHVWAWVSAVAAAGPSAAQRAALASLRSTYEAELASGTARFFEPARDTCWLCGDRSLGVACVSPDRIQLKAGRFQVDQCQSCGHLFQNPRLNAAGLSFYYRDFYDGLGGASLDAVFRMSVPAYRERARAYVGDAPGRWLDVGGGYGHFCLMAREIWPSTQFGCLDMGASADEAARRGWASAGHRGTLPEVAASLAGQFDVVSLSHCLEHTPDPRAELTAARQVLAPSGRLIIEVPDPECLFRSWLGSWWLPYLQPQHLHLLSLPNLKRLLDEAGFEVERTQRGEVHVPSDMVSAVFMAVNSLAPPEFPWRPARAAAPPWLRGALWTLASPWLFWALIADVVIQKLAFLPRLSNAFRVVARVKPSTPGK